MGTFMSGGDIRRSFLNYFEKKGHRILRSSSLVPSDDPTLLFVNAGMVQFKRTFLGEEKRGYKRAVTSQKCVRAGGKHNDLENVGYTARHHTFFEMLGNFSFGDYFKKEAIEFGWDLLTRGYGLPEDKLWVSIYLDDDEAAEIWSKDIGVPDARIKRFGEKDNFWAMGDIGPCGPCSEIHLDRGESFGCKDENCELGCECDRFLEIWNLVFMQFDRDINGKLTPLPRPSIDTGLGLERMASILQNTATNFETDLILPIIETAEKLSEKSRTESKQTEVAMKVIADHSRSAAFLIGDGVLPSNEGRGYVLRRIMRRAIRYGRNIGLKEPFLHVTAATVFDIMKDAYPELEKSASFITNVIKNEELRFIETLDRGLIILNDTLAELEAKKSETVPGDIIFKLYDTYGFPVDIIKDVIRDKNMTLDIKGFEESMEKQRLRSKTKTSFSGISDAYKGIDQGDCCFVGYKDLFCDAKILVITKDGKETAQSGIGENVEIVTDITPCYACSGGQTGDTGKIESKNFQAEITDTIKDPSQIIIHKAKITSGVIKKGDKAIIYADAKQRKATAANHTATHILHYALREVLGSHVKQAGSLVTAQRLRFDFTHFSKPTEEELEKIEALINEKISENLLVETVEMGVEDAVKSGATALFEEKYGEKVRVVSIGDFSKELCGGTHTSRLGNIGLFKIIEETSVAAGIRRIEALTSFAAVNFMQKTEQTLKAVSEKLKTSPRLVLERIEKLLSENKELEKQLKEVKVKITEGAASEDMFKDIETIRDIKVFAKKVSAQDPAELRDILDRLKDKVGSGIVILGSEKDGRAMLIVGVTKDLTKKYNAGKIIKSIAEMVGGKGGGRPDMAQAGGSKPENLDNALKASYDIIKNIS